ncbi:MAG: hypothetical protein ABSF84_03640 [Acidimicrobiales bacterium]|jgi:hypothetical protein
MVDTTVGNDVAVQLIEATHALYRAAVALEAIRPATTMTSTGGRCPFLNEDPGPAQGPGATGRRTVGVHLDSALEDITSVRDVLSQVAAGPTARPADLRAPLDSEVALEDLSATSERISLGRKIVARSDADASAVVIHGIYEAGLALQGALQRSTDPRAIEQIKEAVVLLDQTIADYRTIVTRSDGPER